MKQIYDIVITELHRILHDKGVLVLFVLAPLAYPILYGFVYKNEVLRNVPIAVVDESASAESRSFIRLIDATPETRVADHCLSLADAKRLYQQRKVHGIVLISKDFQDDIFSHRQAHVVVYTDMSSFVYYSTVLSAVSYVANDRGYKIQVERLQNEGLSSRQAEIATQPFTYSNNVLYNFKGGYVSFLLPAILILILHQTLLLGIGMLAGTDREKHRYDKLPQGKSDILYLLVGKSLCYLLIYTCMTAYVIGIVPKLFGLPSIGSPLTLALFILPFLLSTIFLALTIGTFFKSRENSMMLLLFSSIPLLFLSGISWPATAIPDFWKVIGWFFPSTHGIAGYVKINTMQASMSQIASQYLNLWILSGVYFLISYILHTWQLKKQRNPTNF